MSKTRVTLLTVLSVFAVAAVSASAAMADVGQEFVYAEKAAKLGIKGKSAAATLKAGTNVVNCTSSSTIGKLEGTTKVTAVVVTFTGCTSSKGACSKKAIHSVGAAAGTIVTKSLKGELGEGVTQASINGKVVLLLEPPENAETLKEFVTLEANECTIKTQVTGTIAGVVEKTGAKIKVGATRNLVFAEEGGKQQVTALERSVGDALVKTGLKAFGEVATQVVTAAIGFEQEMEITAGA